MFVYIVVYLFIYLLTTYMFISFIRYPAMFLFVREFVCLVIKFRTIYSLTCIFLIYLLICLSIQSSSHSFCCFIIVFLFIHLISYFHLFTFIHLLYICFFILILFYFICNLFIDTVTLINLFYSLSWLSNIVSGKFTH